MTSSRPTRNPYATPQLNNQAKVTTPLNGNPKQEEHWRNWISKADRDHIDAVANSVRENHLPASSALGAVNTARIAAEAEYRATWLARVLQGIRNLGVLFPIIVTWVSLALASSAYSASLASAQTHGAASPDLITVPFLEQWEQGFSAASAPFGQFSVPLVIGDQRWFTFSHFAIVDALLILALVVMTFFAQMVEAVGLSRARAAMRGVEIRLFNIAENRDAFALGGQTLEEKTRSSFDAIGNQLALLQGAITEFTTAMRTVPRETLTLVADQLTTFETEQTGRISEAYHRAANAQATTDQRITLFVNGTDTMLHQITTSVDELTQHWKTLGNHVTTIGAAAQRAAQAAAGAAQTAGQLPGEVSRLTTAQNEVREELARVATTYNQSIARLEGIGSHFDQTTAMQQQMATAQDNARVQMNALQQSSAQIEAVVKRIEELERALGGVININNPKRRRFLGIF